MADELHTPNHRWYQGRYHIPLAKEDHSKQWIFDSGIQKIDAWIALLGGVSAYAIGGLDPSLVFDFDDEYYRTGGTSTDFTSAITHSRTSNATQVDSDGLLKWGPHNLVTYSEDLTQSWTITGTSTIHDAYTVSISGSDAITSAFANTSVGSGYTVEVELWTETDAGEQVDIGFNTNNLSNTFSAPITLTATPTTYSFSKSNNTATQNGFRLRNVGGTAKTVKVSKVRLYRSDLGGMVNNPDRGDSYVPTTSSARYLPRRGHHVWNGTAWVNEGVLHESEARTNLITYSEDFTDASWIDVGLSVVGSTETNLGLSFDRLDINAGVGTHDIYDQLGGLSNPGNYAASCFVKDDGAGYAAINLHGNGSNYVIAIVNLSNGNVENTYVSGSLALLGAGSVDYGGGVYRIWISAENTYSTTLYHIVGPSESANPSISSGRVTYNATDGADILVAGAQFEAGSTPSSYIPTAGATVTRAAETLTIPAANLPWPTVNVIGPELVTNGTFDTDSDWTLGTGWTISGGTANISSAALSGYLTQAITPTAGKVYLFEWTYTGTGQLRLTLPGVSIIDVAQGTHQRVFVATGSGNINIYTQYGATGTLDNVSVREIDPLAVSIQMQGRMTRAVEDGSVTAMPIRWSLDGNNQIRVWTDSSIAGGGVRWDFDQEANTVIDQVSSGYIDPFGINVPFNIASRHGSTFINGAVDGVALTVNPTPTALPNLSATDLNLGYDYMGTIKLFRVWAADLADAGIATASITAPLIFGVPTISGDTADPEVGEVLTAASAPVVIGTPSPTTTWQWKRGGAAIAGATSASYTLTSDDVGFTITVTQTETNAGGNDSATSAATAVVQAIGATIVTDRTGDGIVDRAGSYIEVRA